VAKISRQLLKEEIIFLRTNKGYYPAGDYSFVFFKIDSDYNVAAYFVLENGETSPAFHSLHDAIKHRDTIHAKDV